MVGLTLYRRHTKACRKGYKQNFRVFSPNSKTERARDCECPINAEGTLGIEKLITNRSTRCRSWADAKTIAAQWEDWGQTTPPIHVEAKIITVRYAIESFLASQGPQGRNVEKNTYHAFEVLLLQRLMPFCQNQQYERIKE